MFGTLCPVHLATGKQSVESPSISIAGIMDSATDLLPMAEQLSNNRAPLPRAFFRLVRPPRPDGVAPLQQQYRNDHWQHSMRLDMPPNTNQSNRVRAVRTMMTAPQRPHGDQPLTRERSYIQSSTPEQRLAAAGITHRPRVINFRRPTRRARPVPAPGPDIIAPDRASEISEMLNRVIDIHEANPEASRAVFASMIRRTMPTPPTAHDLIPRARRNNEDLYSETMWLRFRLEYIRLEVGFETRFSDTVADWINWVVFMWFQREFGRV